MQKTIYRSFILTAAILAALCNLFHSHFHGCPDKIAVFRNLQEQKLIYTSHTLVIEHDFFCPICSGLLISDLPAAETEIELEPLGQNYLPFYKGIRAKRLDAVYLSRGPPFPIVFSRIELF